MTDLTPIHSTIAFPESQTGNQFYKRHGKRGLDVCLALLMAVPVASVVALLWVLARLDGGTGFYGHKRVGRNGRMFTCWKIRTMRPDAEAQLQDLLNLDAAARAEWTKGRKITDDPRVTVLGRLLRKTSLDELPQLWNVLIGDMSLVGPRPVPLNELRLYGSHSNFYLKLRPGITGLWQVSGRNAVDYDTRINMDVRYASGVSVSKDLVILFRTIGCVLKRSGL